MWNPIALIVAGVFLASTSFAQSGTSRATNETAAPFFMSWYGYLEGPSVYAVDSEKKVDGDEFLSDDAIDLYNSVKIGFKVRPHIKFFFNPRFVIYPRAANSDGDHFEFLSPRVGIGNSRFIHTKNFNMYASLSAELGTTRSNQEKGRIVGPAVYVVPEYRFPRSNWTLGAYTGSRVWIGPSDKAADVDFYPFLTYRISPKFSALLRWEFDGKWAYQSDGSVAFVSDGQVLKPIIDWNVSDRLTISPQLGLKTGEKVTVKTTHVGLEVSGTLF